MCVREDENVESESTTLNEEYLSQAAAHGVAVAEILRQLRLYMAPPGFAELDRACVPGDGIRSINEVEAERLVEVFARASKTRSIVKFVPASGAASRMFKAPSSVFFRPGPISLAQLRDLADGDGDVAEVVKMIEELGALCVLR